MVKNNDIKYYFPNPSQEYDRKVSDEMKVNKMTTTRL